MGRKLVTTVQVGATVYEAGTDEADIDGEITAAGVFDSENAPVAPPALWDPAEHNLDGDDGVYAYLASADDNERARVLEVERSGKARKGVLEWTPEPVDPAED